MSEAGRDPALGLQAPPDHAVLRVPLSAIGAGVRTLDPDTATYVTRVHRLRAGDRFVVFDPDLAVEADAEVREIGKRSASVAIGSVRAAQRSPGRHVTLLQGIGKGDKMDMIVRDATELGASVVVPVLFERCIARPDASRRDRWRRIAVEAARQSGRSDAPEIAPPSGLSGALCSLPPPVVGAVDARFCLSPRGAVPLGEQLGRSPLAPTVLAVGPEGGFTPVELETLAEAGFAAVTLGPLVLRTETVCAAVLGALRVWDQAYVSRAGNATTLP